MWSTKSPHQNPHREDEPPPLLCPHTSDPGRSCETSETLSSGAGGGESVRTHFMHFTTIFECNQLVPGGESRATKSLKEDTTKCNIQGQNALSAVELHPTKLQTKSPPKSHQVNLTRLEPPPQGHPTVFPRAENPNLTW